MRNEAEVSEWTIKYRIRVQIIWYLETASSSTDQRKYEKGLRDANAPGNVPNEMINQWEDLVRIEDLDWYGEPQFSKGERTAIARFHAVWDEVADATPEPMPDTIEDLIDTPAWQKLENGAREALRVFMIRGHLLDQANF